MNSGCGHTYCRSCVEAWRAKQESCPICRTALATLLPNLTAKHLLDTLVIHCRYGLSLQADGEWRVDPSGCPEVIECQRRNKHESKCPFAAIPCPNDPEGCGKIVRKDLQKHREVCPFGLISRPEDIIKLSVGGRLFTTTRQTLCKYPSKLKTLVEDAKRYATLPKDEHGAVFIDKNGSDFATVLEFLRSDNACMETASGDMKELLQSFGFISLQAKGQSLQQFMKKQPRQQLLPRTDGVYLGTVGNYKTYFEVLLFFYNETDKMQLFVGGREANCTRSNVFLSSGFTQFTTDSHCVISLPPSSLLTLDGTMQSMTVVGEGCIAYGSSLLVFHPYQNPTETSYFGRIMNLDTCNTTDKKIHFTSVNWSKDPKTNELMFKGEIGEPHSGYCCGQFLLLRGVPSRRYPEITNYFYLLQATIPPRR